MRVQGCGGTECRTVVRDCRTVVRDCRVVVREFRAVVGETAGLWWITGSFQCLPRPLVTFYSRSEELEASIIPKIN